MSGLSKSTHLTHNFWVGFFTIIGVLVLTAVTLSLRNWDFLSNRTTYYARFANVKKLDVGAKVLASGVEVGEATGLESINQDGYRVLVRMRIDDEVKLYPDAKVTVAPAAVIGDTTINMDVGSGGNPLDAGAVINGQSAPEIEDIARDVSESINSVVSLLKDPKTRDAIQRTLINLASSTEKIDATFGMINTELRPLVEDLHRTTNNFNKLVDEARSFTGRVGNDVSSVRGDFSRTAQAWTKTAGELSAQVERTATSLEKIATQLQGTVQENRQPLNQSLTELRDTARALRETADKLRTGDGTLGKLMNDPALYDSLMRSLDRVSQVLGGGAQPAFNYDSGPARRPQPNAGTISPVGEEPGQPEDADGSPATRRPAP